MVVSVGVSQNVDCQQATVELVKLSVSISDSENGEWMVSGDFSSKQYVLRTHTSYNSMF